jgi:hypothetical protein
MWEDDGELENMGKLWRTRKNMSMMENYSTVENMGRQWKTRSTVI